MKQFTSRYLQLHMSECLKNMPFEVTTYGKVIGVMIPQDKSIVLTQLEKKGEKVLTDSTEKKDVLTHTQENKESFESALVGTCEVIGCKYFGQRIEGEYKEWDGQRGEMRKRPMLMCQKHFIKYSNMSEF